MSGSTSSEVIRIKTCHPGEDVLIQLLSELPEISINQLSQTERTCAICFYAYNARRRRIYLDVDHDTEVDEDEATLARRSRSHIYKQVRKTGNGAWADAHDIDIHYDSTSDSPVDQLSKDEPKMTRRGVDYVETSLLDPPIRLPCSHIFGRACVGQWFSPKRSMGGGSDTCPVCRAKIFVVESPEEKGEPVVDEMLQLVEDRLARVRRGNGHRRSAEDGEAAASRRDQRGNEDR